MVHALYLKRAVPGWVKFDYDNYETWPPQDPDFGELDSPQNTLSVPVLVGNAVTGQVFEEVVRFQYLARLRGWVYSSLVDGPNPENYEVCHVTHWMALSTLSAELTSTKE